MAADRDHVCCRDGVSEGQFYQVLLHELEAIRKVKVFRVAAGTWIRQRILF